MHALARLGAVLLTSLAAATAAGAGLSLQGGQSSVYTFGPGAKGSFGLHGSGPKGSLNPSSAYFPGPPPQQPPANFRRENHNGRLRIDPPPSIRYEQRMRQLYEPSYGYSLYHGYRGPYGFGGVLPEDRPPAPESVRP